MKALIVCGSRDWSDREAIWETLNREAPRVVIHGACRGADDLAGHWVYRQQERNAECIEMPAQWADYGKGAGPMRNAAMLRVLQALGECGYEMAVHAFVLPNSRGTWDMVNKAKGVGVTVHVHKGEA